MTSALILLIFQSAGFEEQTLPPPTYPRGQIRRQEDEDTYVRKVDEEP